MVYVYSPRKEEKLRDELPDIVRKGTQFYIEEGRGIGLNELNRDMTRAEFLKYCGIQSLNQSYVDLGDRLDNSEILSNEYAGGLA